MESRLSQRLPAVILAVALLAYAIFLASHTSPAAAGSDSGGYLLSAKLLAEGRLAAPLRVLPEFPAAEPWEYTPLGTIFSERLGELIPTYPVGLPLLYALASSLTGWTWGPIAVSTLMACGAVAFTYLSGRELGIRREYAVLAAAALAVCPLVLFTTFQPLSDTATTCWNAAAVFCALRARRLDGHGWRWAAGSGAMLAVSVLVRPANLLLSPVLLVILVRPGLLLAAGAGGLPGAIFLGWYQHALYGSVLVTGYGSVWGMFGREHVMPALQKYVAWIPVFLPFAVMALVAIPWLPWRRRGREFAALLLWIGVYAGFYAFYPPTHEHRWYLRFVLPMFPALLLLAASGLEAIVERWGSSARAARPVALGIGFSLSLAASWQQWRVARLDELEAATDVFQRVATWADENLPENAVVLTLFASGSFYYYTEFPVIRPDVITPSRFRELAGATRAHQRPVYAVLADSEEKPALEGVNESWTEVQHIGTFRIWRLDHSPRS